ncbi:hypothetical protein NE236_19165 [Actinoallomurus purpureus]|uniref:hypothetical protein n=1 Tax=Actinoallomurus purpureus TaxID=478114 RepID=UPI00209345F7|nr:hypothetical protein [Actinoallomurus purpureus]MCO6007105.1 hypothetical protein [Actinoallomurus purpureus]
METGEPDAETSTPKAQPVKARLDELAAALVELGLTVRVGTGALVAWNSAASRTDDPVGKAMNPGLSQYVALCEHDDDSLHWYWCWTGPTRDAPLETEYMCPAREIEHAAHLIAKVLHVDDAEDR